MTITRRNFIIKAGAFTSASLIAELIGRTVKPAYCDTEKKALNKILHPELLEILKYASLAPSGHNSQPWQIKIKSPHSWELGLAPERTLPAVDPDNREAKLSLGAFLHNLKMAASVYGYNVDLSFHPKTADEVFAGISIKAASSAGGRENLTLMEKRYTHRRALKNEEFTAQTVESISGKNTAIHYIPGNSACGKILAEGTIEANRSQAGRIEAMEELSQWIRWSDEDAEKFHTGITPESMGITGFPLWYVKHFYGPENVLKPGFSEKTVESAAASVKHCGGWLLITSGKNDSRALAETGMLFEEMFLKSTRQGIGIHPMTQLLEEAHFMDSINSQLGIRENIQFIIRTGYSEKFTAYKKLRLPSASFVI